MSEPSPTNQEAKPVIDARKEKLIEIPDYGYVVLKKYTFMDRCSLKGKVVTIDISPVTKREAEKIDTGAMFFWSVVYSIKALPGHPEFHTYPEEKKSSIVQELGDFGELILREAMAYNKLNPAEAKKK